MNALVGRRRAGLSSLSLLLRSCFRRIVSAPGWRSCVVDHEFAFLAVGCVQRADSVVQARTKRCPEVHELHAAHTVCQFAHVHARMLDFTHHAVALKLLPQVVHDARKPLSSADLDLVLAENGRVARCAQENDHLVRGCGAAAAVGVLGHAASHSHKQRRCSASCCQRVIVLFSLRGPMTRERGAAAAWRRP
jgi:hypothetical protein